MASTKSGIIIESNVRPEAPADRDAIRTANELAFGRGDEADIVDLVRASAGFVPELSLVAEHAGRVVGHALFSKVTVQGETEAWPVLGLGPIAVLPDYQGRGIGASLINAGLGRARDLDFLAVVVLGHASYYPRFGFVPASRFGLRSTFRVPDEVFMAMPLHPGSLDSVTGTVIYPAAFHV